MNIEQAIQNIDILIQNTRMTRQEHVELDSNLKLLVARAKLADKLEKEIAEETVEEPVDLPDPDDKTSVEVPDGTVTRIE